MQQIWILRRISSIKKTWNIKSIPTLCCIEVKYFENSSSGSSGGAGEATGAREQSTEHGGGGGREQLGDR